VSQRALHATRRQAARGIVGQDRRALSLRRWALGAAAYEFSASPRRRAEAARLRLFARSRATRTRWLAGGEIRDRRGRGRAGGDGDALVRRMGCTRTGPCRRGPAGALDREDRRCAAGAVTAR